MAWLRSVPAGGLPIRDTLAAGIGAVLIPSLLGLVLLGVFKAFGQAIGGDGALALWGGSMMLLLSPLLTGAGMILAMPLTAILLREGWFGWLPALALGLAIGGVAGVVAELPVAAPFGGAVLIIMRALLGRLRDLG